MAITRYAGDRFVVDAGDTKPTGVLDGAFLVDTGNLASWVLTPTGWSPIAGGGGGGGSTSPGGSNTQVQFNNALGLLAEMDLTFTNGNQLNVNKLSIAGNVIDSNTWIGENGMVLTNEGATGVNWKSIESVLSGVGGSGVANYVARWSDEDTLTSGTIYDNGDVGIGTANPGAKLHVYDTVNSDLVIIESTHPAAADAPDVIFYRNSASPADNDLLGTLDFKGRNDNSQDVQYANIVAQAIDVSDGTEDGALKFNTIVAGTDTETMVIKSANVGIGTVTPATPLHITKSAVGDNEVPEVIRLSTLNSASPSWSTTDGLCIGAEMKKANGTTITKQPIKFRYDGGDMATTLEEGKVGIGTNAPVTPLHVNSDGTANGTAMTNQILRITPADGNNGINIGSDGTNGLIGPTNNDTDLRFLSRTGGTYSYAMTINGADGNVGIGTDAPSELLEVKGNMTLRGATNLRYKIANDSNNNWAEIGNDGATGENTLEFFTGSSSVASMSITNAKQVLVGDSTALGPFGEWNWTPLLQQLGTQGIVTVRCGADVYGGAMHLASARGSNASPTIVLNGDRAGGVYYHAYDGANFSNTPGAIECFIDGAPAADDTPGRLVFSTAPDGSNSITERMRITSSGLVGIGTNNPVYTLQGNGTNGGIIGVTRTTGNTTGTLGHVRFGNTDVDSDLANIKGVQDGATDSARLEFETQATGGSATARMTIKSDGKVGIGTLTPAVPLHIYTDSASGQEIMLENDGSGEVGLILRTDRKTNGALTGWIGFDAHDAGDNNTRYATIEAYSDDVTGGSEDGRLTFSTMVGATDTETMHIVGGNVGIATAAPASKLHVYGSNAETTIAKIDGSLRMGVLNSYIKDHNDYKLLRFTNAGLVYNEDGAAALDFRMEGDADINLFFLDASADKVGIGTNAPETKLHVEGSNFVGSSIKMERSGSGVNEDAGLIFSKSAAATDGHRLGGVYFGAEGTNYGLIRGEMDGTTGGKIYFVAGSQTNVISNTAAKTLEIAAGTITAKAAIRPLDDSSYTLGQSSLKWSELYVDSIKDVNNNTGSANQVLSAGGSGGSLDWVTLSEISGVDGSGTANYIPKWTDSDTIGNSTIYTDGQDVAIGSTAFGVGGTIDLSIGNPGSTAGGITLWNTTSGVHSIGFGDANSGTARYEGYLEYSHADNSMRFGTLHAERMRINNLGYVGINTTTPATELHAHGTTLTGRTSGDTGSYVANSYDLIVSNGGSGTVVLLYNDAGAFQSSLIKYDTNCLKLGLNNSSSTNAIWTTTAVNVGSVGVGIGTVTPGGLLEVYAAAGLVASHVKSGTVISRLTANSSASDAVVGTSSAHDFLIQRAGSTRMTFSGSSVVVNDSGEDIDFRVEGDTDTNLIRTDAANERVGIGTNAPSSKLHVNSEISCGADDNNRAMFGYTPSRFYLGTRQSGTNYLNTVSVTSGKVGIGTNAPAYTLQVAGNMGVSQYIFHNDDADTFINFTDDDINFTAGDVNFIDLTQGGTNEITFNEGGLDVDVRMEGDTNANLFFLDASVDKIGIGTNAPDGLLHVNNTTYIDVTTNTGTASALIWRRLDKTIVGRIVADTTNLKTQIWDNNSAVVTIGSDQVGIGTDAPAALLNLFKTGTNDAVSSAIYLQRAAGNYGCAILQVGNGSSGYEKLMFTAGHNSDPMAISNAKMTIQHDGNVGIGTTSPSVELVAIGNVIFRHDTNSPAGYASGTDLAVFGSHNSTGTLFEVFTQGDVSRLKILGSGATTVNGDLNFGTMGQYLTFYGGGETEHSISSRNSSGNAADDLRINTFGALFINLDSNNNNTSGADFSIGRHGQTGALSDWLLDLSGETGKLQLNKYGSGTHTGTLAKSLGVDSSGNIIEFTGGTGTVTGSGTTNYVPKFTSSTALGNSALYDGGGSNIGIGTNNPYYALDVRFTNSATSFSGGSSGNWGGSGLRLQNASTTAGAMALIQFRTSTTEWFIGNKFISSSPDKSDFIFNHEDSEKVRFTNDGNVGIGTNAPWEKLTVFGGGINFGSSPTVNNSGKFTYNSTSGQLKLSAHSTGGNTYQTFTVSNSGSQVDAVTILNDGKVGIGTATPGSLLTVSGNSDDGDAACTIAINDEDSTVGSKIPAIQFYGGGTTQGRIRGGDAAFSIAVGSSPTTALSINTANGYPSFTYGSQVRLTLGSTGTAETNDANWIRSNGANLEFNAASGDFNWEVGGAHKMRLTDSGVLGVGLGAGTDPFGTIHANGTNGGIFQVTRTSGGTTSTLGIVRFGNTDIDSNLINIKGIQDGATDSARLEFQTQPTGGATVTRMTIKSDGKVGVGTDSPGRIFTVQGGSGDNLPARIIAGASTTKCALEFQDPDTTADYKVTLGSIGDNMFFQAGGSERARILSSGFFGIGTGSPSTKLNVHSGDITITSGKQLISTNSYTQAPNAMLTTQGPSTGATTLGTGTWGIMLGPQHSRSTTANTYYPGIAFNQLLNTGGTVTYNNHPQAWIGTRLHDTPGSERAFLVFSTKSGTGVTASDVPLERMCIDPVDGFVGIGTTNPQVLLDVYTSDSDTARFESTSTSRSTVSIRSGSTGDAQIRFQNAAASKWSIGNDGGDSDKFKIAVGSGAFVATEAFTITTSGSVGIGIGAPSQLLHVNGGSDANLRLTSASTRSGVFIDKPGTTTIMGSALVLADETYKLGTASYYHVIMYQGGATYLLHQGNTKIQTTATGVTVTGTLTETSSITLKENVETYTPSLDIINKIRPVKYNRKTNKDKKEIGLIAEELAELFPELVEKDEKGNPSSVNYSRAVTVLLGGFKELYKEIEELKKRI